MEQLRNRQNIHLRSEITPDAKFLALGITPLDSDHAEYIKERLVYGGYSIQVF